MTAAAAASSSWQPASLDAEFSPQTMLTRLRYRAPGPGHDDKSYSSLPDLIIDRAAASHLVDVDVDNDSDSAAATAEEEEEDNVIAEYMALMATNVRARGRMANHLRDSAKRHLLAAGWTFWMKLKSNGREELRYRAPTGRSYISLHTACQAFKASRLHCGGEDAGTRPVVMKKRKLSELLGDGDAVKNVMTMKTCTTTIKKKTLDGTQVMTKKSITRTTLMTRKKKRNQARVLLRPNSTTCHGRSRTLLSVLIDKGIVVPRDKVVACRDGPAAKHGFITGEGIRCTCCNRTLTVAEFEAHGRSTAGAGAGAGAHATATGINSRGDPWSRVFLKDKDKHKHKDKSLSQCLVELMRRDVAKGVVAPRSSGVRVKTCGDPEGDSVCSICNDGGELLLCDSCPSAFHHACVGLQATPEGDWFCPSCRCAVCGGSGPSTIIYCDQCERQYHVGCVRRQEEKLSEEENENWCRRLVPWLCSRQCGHVFEHLQGLARAGPIPTAVQGVSLCILRRRRRHDHHDAHACEHETRMDACEHAQLCAALDVLHECFITLMEPRTQTDLTADIVFNRESDLRRLNFRGYYVVGLEKAGELVTVGTLRVLGAEVAELPLVGTRFAHRRQGMCHLLMTELDKVLRQAGVRRLVLPAVPELLPMWTAASLGFHPMTHSDMMEIAAEHAILSFQGTTMCQKTLLP